MTSCHQSRVPRRLRLQSHRHPSHSHPSCHRHHPRLCLTRWSAVTTSSTSATATKVPTSLAVPSAVCDSSHDESFGNHSTNVGDFAYDPGGWSSCCNTSGDVYAYNLRGDGLGLTMDCRKTHVTLKGSDNARKTIDNASPAHLSAGSNIHRDASIVFVN